MRERGRPGDRGGQHNGGPVRTPPMLPLHEWVLPLGVVTTWRPTAATSVLVRHAGPSPVPPSHEQQEHIRTYLRFTEEGLAMSRLLTVAWTEPGACDLEAMTKAIEAHVRRHDTYASRFVVLDDGHLERRVIDDRSEIRFEPVARGEMSGEDWRDALLDTPGPLEWDCFTFHVVQHEEDFVFCACIDHLVADGSLVVPVFADIHDTYAALCAGRPQPLLASSASHIDYCARQQVRVRSLTPQSGEVRAWNEYLCPVDPSAITPLPVGSATAITPGSLSTHWLVDVAAVDAFEQACVATGNRMIGGVLAAVALAWAEVGGSTTFRGLVPVTTPEDHGGLEFHGWFSGVVPVAFSVAGCTLAEATTVAQSAYSGARPLSALPPGAVADLLGADVVPSVAWSAPLVSFWDASRPTPGDSVARWLAHDGRSMLNQGASEQVGLWINRSPAGAFVTVSVPDTPEAHRSRDRLVARLRALLEQGAARSGPAGVHS